MAVLTGEPIGSIGRVSSDTSPATSTPPLKTRNTDLDTPISHPADGFNPYPIKSKFQKFNSRTLGISIFPRIFINLPLKDGLNRCDSDGKRYYPISNKERAGNPNDVTSSLE